MLRVLLLKAGRTLFDDPEAASTGPDELAMNLPRAGVEVSRNFQSMLLLGTVCVRPCDEAHSDVLCLYVRRTRGSHHTAKGLVQVRDRLCISSSPMILVVWR